MLNAFSIIIVILHLQASLSVCPPLILFNAAEDARIIDNEGATPDVLIRILACRTSQQRLQINEEYKKRKQGQSSLDRKTQHHHSKIFQIVDRGSSEEITGDPFLDAVDVLVDIPQNTFIRFMEGAFYSDYQTITSFKMLIQILIAADLNRKALVDQYNAYAGGDHHVRDEIGDQFDECDWRHMLRELTVKFREPDGPVDAAEVKRQVDRLIKEKDDKGWDDNRKVLEYVLMEQSHAFIRAFLPVYSETAKQTLENDIRKELGHNEHITFGYISLVQAGINMNKFIADRIHNAINDEDKVGAMTVFVIHFSEDPVFKNIKDEFHKAYGIGMGKYILNQNPSAPINRLLAELVRDP